MPKIIMIYDEKWVKCSPDDLKDLGAQLAITVAADFSTDTVKLDPNTDIDFILQPLVVGSIAAPVSFEIEAIGYPDRKLRLNYAVMKAMKSSFISIMGFFAGMPLIDKDKPLIWLKYVDPDGHHI